MSNSTCSIIKLPLTPIFHVWTKLILLSFFCFAKWDQTLLTVINTLHKSISETEFLPQYIYFVFSYRIWKPINGNPKGFVNSFPGYIAKGVTVGSGRVIQNQSPTVFLLLLLPNLSQHCLLCMKNIRETFTVQSLWYAQFQS